MQKGQGAIERFGSKILESSESGVGRPSRKIIEKLRPVWVLNFHIVVGGVQIWHVRSIFRSRESRE